MTTVERLVQQLAGDITLTGGPNTAAMQGVLTRHLRIDVANLGQDLPQL